MGAVGKKRSAERVEEATAFHAALARAIATPGPRLIEAVI